MLLSEKNEIVLKPGDKYLISIQEASMYFGMNASKIRSIARENVGVSLYNGNKQMIKRAMFEKLLDDLDNV